MREKEREREREKECTTTKKTKKGVLERLREETEQVVRSLERERGG